MSDELETIDGDAQEEGGVALAPPAPAHVQPSDQQKASKLWKHPDRDKLHALLRRGKSADWIALWLEEEYPLEDEDGSPDPDARAHAKLHLEPRTIEKYRAEFMPEATPGLDVLSPELEEAIGRRFPAPPSSQFETEIMEAGIRAAEMNLARAMGQDAEMGMLQPTTLQAQAQLMDAAQKSVDVKAKLGIYEAAPEKVHQTVDQTNRNLNVDLHGKIGPDGKVEASEPEKVGVLAKFMAMEPDEASAALERAKEASPAPPPPAASEDGVVDAEVVEEPEESDDHAVELAATEIPEDEDLDGEGAAGENRRGTEGDSA